VDVPGEATQAHLKVNALSVPAGTIIRSHTGGGGGYGPALERDVELVRQDVVDGFVSKQKAWADYGVVLNDDLSVDNEATDEARSAMR